MRNVDVAIIGGGMAGLTCAKVLTDNNRDWILFEASDRVGGRIKTDEYEGFLLDHGFQVLLTAYPEVQRFIDLELLPFTTFDPGAFIRKKDQLSLYADPLRRPDQIFHTIFSKIGNVYDKWNIARLRAELEFISVEEIFKNEEKTSYQFLKEYGFSENCINDFFRPFFGGIFLENELRTSSLQLKFIFKMFSQGSAALPDRGIQAVPLWISDQLPQDKIQLASPIHSIDKGQNLLITQSGETIHAKTIVLATDSDHARKLLGCNDGAKGRDVSCYYFSCSDIPDISPILYLNADKSDILHLCFPSKINPSYAPKGKHLVSVSSLTLKGSNGFEIILSELSKWFGSTVRDWIPLRHYKIENALPESKSLKSSAISKRVDTHFYICGDYTNNPGLNGAMKSGRLVAESIVAKDTF